MQQPLAIAVIGGLMIALLLSLIVTPTVYAMLNRRRAQRIILHLREFVPDGK